MKILMFSLLTALTLLSTPSSSQAAPHGLNVLISGLNELRVSPFLLTYNNGHLTIDEKKSRMRLVLNQATCRPGFEGDSARGCDFLNEIVFVYEITETGTSCGSKVFSGRQIDGGFAQSTSTLVVVDHRSRMCRDLPPHRTEITQKIEGRGHVLENYFGGSELTPPYER